MLITKIYSLTSQFEVAVVDKKQLKKMKLKLEQSSSTPFCIIQKMITEKNQGMNFYCWNLIFTSKVCPE